MKQNYKRGLFYAVLAAVVVSLCVYGAHRSGLIGGDPIVEEVAENCYGNTLHVISDKDYCPYSYFDEKTGEYTGHDVEFVTKLANHLHMNLDLRFLPWDEGIEAVRRGDAEVLMTCDYSDTFSGTEELDKSRSISFDNFIVYCRSNTRMKSVDDLRGKRIGVMRHGNVMAQLHMLNLEKYCVEFFDNREAMRALKKGEVDCAVMRNTVGRALQKELDARELKGKLSIGHSYMCFGIHRGNRELRGKIDQAIEEMKETGELQRFRRKWLKSSMEPFNAWDVFSSNVTSTLIFGFFALGLVALILVDYDRKQKTQQEKKEFANMLEKLASDFEYVCCVTAKENKLEDTTTLIRASELFRRLMPGWDEEPMFTKRLDMLIDNLVLPEDREMFYRRTRREMVELHLKRDNVHYVNFRATIDGEMHYYQMKFSAYREHDEGELVSFVCGVRNIDEQTRKELDEKEQLEDSMHIIGGLASQFQVLYYIDLEKCETKFVRGDEDAKKFLGIFNAANVDALFERFNEFYVDTIVEEEDRAHVKEIMNAKHMYNKLRSSNSMNVFFRARRNLVDLVYTEMRVMKAGETEDGTVTAVMLGFRLAGDETQQMMELNRQIQQQNLKLAEDNLREKELQRTLKEAKEQVEAASKSKTDFLFNMSHDIRTPMNAIIGYTRIAKEKCDDPRWVKDCLGKISASGKHLLNLINEVLDMSRVEAGKMHSETKLVDVLEKSQNVIDICKETAEEKGIDLFMEDRGVEHRHVLADELHVDQIIMNIMGNALKYTPAGGSVVFSVSEVPSKHPGYGLYKFVIEDTGIGMSQEFLERIYDSFSREETTTNSGIEGTGLGMSIVKRLVDYLDGTIDIESELNEGTRVCVGLHMKLVEDPAQFEKDVESSQVVKQNKPQSGMEKPMDDSFLRGKRMLLVEDNDLNREIARYLLVDKGFLVEEANDGLEAVRLVKERGVDYYDCVLMDIQMPFMDGFEATEKIRKMRGGDRLPIVALSANAFEEDRKRSLAAGMNDHLAKPIDPEMLSSVLGRILAS